MCGVSSHPSLQWVEYAEKSPYLAYCLPRLLRDLGWSTRFFTGSTVGFQPRLGFELSLGGERIVHDAYKHHEHQPYQRASFLGYDERIVLSPLKKWLSTLGDAVPGFAVIGTLSTHAPYTLANSSRAQRIANVVRRATSNSFRGREGKKRDEYAAYLTAIHEIDDFIKEVFQTIAQSTKGKDSVIVVVGDHGEAFLEHPASHFHGGTPYSEQVHIPCFIVDRRKEKNHLQTLSKPWSTLSFRWFLFALIGFESYAEKHFPPSSVPFPYAIGSKQKKRRNQVCSAISSSLLDERVMACSAGDLKVMVLQEPYRIATFNASVDPFDEHEIKGAPRFIVRSALKEMAEFNKIARERHRESMGSGLGLSPV
jgi:hypothetical protein